MLNELVRKYNQNRKKIWTIILGIVLVLVVIQILNNFAGKSLEEKNKKVLEEARKQENLYNQSRSITSSQDIPEENRQKNNELIETFLKSCVDNNIEKAYELLSKECRNSLYGNEIELFKSRYYERYFGGNISYSFQAWSTDGVEIYKVKIFENMLATGIASNNSYKEDFYTIVKEGNEQKLNIFSFVGKMTINKKESKDNLEIMVEDVETFMEYKIYNIRVINNSDKTVLLDRMKENDSIYIENDNGIKFEVATYEILDRDLIVEDGGSKEVTIKVYTQNRRNIKKIVFSDIVKDAEKYMENKQNYQDIFSIEVNI